MPTSEERPMDGSRFDDLTKLLGAQRSRRGVLGALAGAALASLGLRSETEAAGCGQAGQRCGAKGCCGGTTCLHGTCCANALVCGSACCPSGYQCQNGACVRSGNSGGTTGGCPTEQANCSGTCVAIASDVNNCGACGHVRPAATDPCHVAACTNGTCGLAPANEGGSCPGNGDKCFGGFVCSSGSCVGAQPVVCAASDQCHDVGTCNPATGLCSNPAKADGTACDDHNACTQTDMCQNGTCVGSNPVVCTALDQCHVPGTCDPATGTCSNPDIADGTSCNDDNACTTGDTCQKGVCTGGAAAACTASGPCMTPTCDPATGCGETPKAAGTACDDDTLCDGHETCDGSGHCQPGTPVTCGPCLICDPTTGSCNPDPAQVGQSCPSDGNLCHGGFQCTAAGVCAPTTFVTCAALDQCHVAGTCNPTSGLCDNPNAPDTTSCDDGNKCTTGDQCLAGVCTAGAPVECPPLNVCQYAGTCNKTTGLCDNPQVADNTPCDDGNPCTTNDFCWEGRCLGGGLAACTTPNECFTAGTCQFATGQCSAANYRGDGATCSTGVCWNQACCTPLTKAQACANGACGPQSDGCGGTFQCLAPADASCQLDSDCCSGVCVNGVCQAGPVAVGGACDNYGDCASGNCCSGVCSDPNTDLNNCGGCGYVCSTNHVEGLACVNGQCQGTCAAGWADCYAGLQYDGCETDLNNDVNNCGGCGNTCPTSANGAATCVGGTCGIQCVSGFTLCGGACVDEQTDLNNCGACGHVCPSTQYCSVGSCVDRVGVGSACASNDACLNSTCCSGICLDLNTDLNNCGACGAVCSNNHDDASVCSGGVCGGYCATGWGNCDGNLQTNGCETDIFSDPDHCGACGTACPTAGAATRTCSFGVCIVTCADGFANCTNSTAISTEGCPVNLNTDNSNCGACGNACASGQYCSGGTCVAKLATGSACTASGQCVTGLCCGGICVDMSTDSNNCGGCGVQCPSAQTCVNGACACPAGETYCFGNCVNLLTDFNNCGFCTLYCGTNETCVNGTCDCLQPLSYCLLGASPHVYYACIDVTSDSNNCGACGNVCGSDEACMNGQCICQAQSCCPAGQTYCAATVNGAPAGCTDVSTDPDNCGGCSNAGGAIGGSICGLLNNDTACCGGTCVDPRTDSHNCGSCGHACAAGGIYTGACQLGVCAETDCTAPYANCNGASGCGTNLSTDVNNCGACGHVCSGSGEVVSCQNGGCCVEDGSSCVVTGLPCCSGARCDTLGLC
jgi:hypothetical protein